MAYVPGAERREQIIKAAVEVVAAEGLNGATTRRVAERANAPLGALHYCFRNKDELIRLVMAKGAERLVEVFSDVTHTGGIESTIRQCISALWAWYREDIGLQLALTEFGMGRIRRGGDAEEMYAMWAPFGRDLLTHHLTSAAQHDTTDYAVPVEEIVRFILHRFDGMTLEYAASQDQAACERQLEILADAMVRISGAGDRREPVAHP